MKPIIASLLLLVAIASCEGEKRAAIATTVGSASPGAWMTSVTATPITFDPSSQVITNVIDGFFDKRTCVKTDYLTPKAPAGVQGFDGYQVGEPEFVEITNGVDLSRISVQEVADSIHGTFRAYLISEPESNSSCPACARSRVYFEERASKRVYEIDWRGYMPSRVLGRLIWVGDNVLTLFQSVGPHSDELIGINVDEKVLVYYAGLSCY